MRYPWTTAVALLCLCTPASLAFQVGGATGGGGQVGGAVPGGGSGGGSLPTPTPVPGHVPTDQPTYGGNGIPGDAVQPGGGPSGGRLGGGGGGIGAPSTPGTNRGPTPSTSGGAPPPGAPGATAPGAGASGSLDPTDWRAWWELNQHDYLGLKSAIWNPGALTESSGFYLGAGSRMEVLMGLKPEEQELHTLVAPALARIAAAHDDPAVLGPTLMAFAKLGKLPALPGEHTRASILQERLRSTNPEIAELAILALGLCNERDLLFELSSILLNDEQGCVLVARPRVPERMRAFAAYALGLAAERDPHPEQTRFVVDRLTRMIDDESTRSSEVAIACIHGLSLLEMPDTPRTNVMADADSPLLGRETLVNYLLAILRDRRAPVEVRAHVPRALARHVAPIGDPLKPMVANALIDTIRQARLATRELRFGAVQALGLLGTSGPDSVDAEIRRELEKAYARGDAATRYLAMISIGKVSARADRSKPGGMAGAARLRDLLFQELMQGDGRSRSWAALALGVRGHALNEAGEAQSQQVTDALIRLLEAEAAPTEAGAYALALGLRGDIRAADVLRARLAYFHVDETRALLALSLGMVQSTHSTDQLRELLAASEQQPYTMRACAGALVLLGDKSIAPDLARRMLDQDNLELRARYAWALAWIGDARCLDPLVALLEDPNGTSETRTYAAIGLGWVGERTERPWSARLASDVNHLSAPSSLYDPAGGGVLNMP